MSKCTLIFTVEVKIVSKTGKKEVQQNRSNWKTMLIIFLQLSRFGAIEFVPRGRTVNQECCVSLQGVYEKQKEMTGTLPAAYGSI